MSEEFNEMMYNINIGNWTIAQNIFKQLPFKMSPKEFSDIIKGLSENELRDVALVEFYAISNEE